MLAEVLRGLIDDLKKRQQELNESVSRLGGQDLKTLHEQKEFMDRLRRAGL